MSLTILVILIVVFLAFLLGIFRPWWILWFMDVKTRMKVLALFLPPLLILLLLYLSSVYN